MSTLADSASKPDDPPAWDHTKRRVIVDNVVKFLDHKALKKIIDGWIVLFKAKHPDITIGYDKFKKPPKNSFCVITLKDESMAKPFVDFINTGELTNKKGGKLFAKLAEDSRKRGNGDDDDKGSTKRSRFSEDHMTAARRPVTEEEIKNRITPLWKLSKEEQELKKIREMAKRCAKKIVSDVKQRFRVLGREKTREKLEVYPWLEGKRCIHMDSIVSAPTPLRNKSEFTFGYRYLFNEKKEDTTPTGEDETSADAASKDETPKEPSKVPAVGFMITGWVGGVSPPHCCDNTPQEVCKIVDIVDEFLADSPLPPYDTKVHQGFWRTLTVRSSRRTQECMVIIQHTPVSGGVGDKDAAHSEHFEKERARLVSTLTEAELPVPDQVPLKVTSIFFQEFDGVSIPPPEHPVQHVYGKKFLTERLGKCTFQISPGAFFQVNTEGAEILYKIAVEKVREVSKEPENTLLFDVCCGTGTIGLTCMKEGAVGKVIGVDISKPAIEDAKRNAELNGFEASDSTGDDQKTRFVAARAEHVLSKEIAKMKDSKMQFVAIVDPAREGLHADVVKTLRANERIQRVVYVSCNPTKTLVRDAALFCQPPTKKYIGAPFKVSSSSPVDMFPLTDHCELVMVFDRMTAEETGESCAS